MNYTLAISPHTDDCEIGAGGYISKLVKSDVKVDHLILSNAIESLPKHLPNDQLLKESKLAAKVLGFNRTIIENFPVRNFPKYRQEILEKLYTLSSSKRYSRVLLPSRVDIHQDHSTVCDEAIRAFKNVTILGYELPWNNLRTDFGYFVALSEENLLTKKAAIKCYKSQSHRPYFQEDCAEILAKMRGLQVGRKYAEAFEVIRMIDECNCKTS